MRHTAHTAAYLLHPQYQGENLTNNEMGEATEFIIELGTNMGLDSDILLTEIAEFRAKHNF